MYCLGMVHLAAFGQHQDGGLADLGHVPGVVAGVHHAADLRGGLGVGLHAHDLDAGGFRERLVEHGAIRLAVDAAVVAHDDALGRRTRRRPDHGHGQRGGAGGNGFQRAAARSVVGGRFHGRLLRVGSGTTDQERRLKAASGRG
ncbi:hypothetical protein G6F31_019840 [Rhizopus arrhizus]|nr:hypothetical protein G6F31_019840 [Rhizopus arrhizus]